jgi:hypothetical protein
MLKQAGISAFPLSKGRDTGRGLERVIAELAAGLDALRQPYAFYERGIIRNEVVAVLHAAKFLWDLRGRHQDVWFAVYPVAGIFPILAGKRPVITGVYDLIPFFVSGFDNSLKYFIKRRCIEFVCRRSDGLIVPFASTAEQIQEMFGVGKDRIRVMPQSRSAGLGSDFWAKPSVQKGSIPQSWLSPKSQSRIRMHSLR